MDDLENQVRDIQIAAVRAHVRGNIVAWLWKDGKDDTERAEPLAVKAVEELYEKRKEIPSVYFSSIRSNLFSLLEMNARPTAKRLADKYAFTSQDELEDARSLLDKKGGESIVAKKILDSLLGPGEFNMDIPLLLDEFQSRKSPELIRILNSIVSLSEAGSFHISDSLLSSIVHNFRDPSVTSALRNRFLSLAIFRARNALNTPGSDYETTYRLLNYALPDILVSLPGMSAEANALQIALSARISRTLSDARERERTESRKAPINLALLSPKRKRQMTMGPNTFFI